jgi:hypothetical protein
MGFKSGACRCTIILVSFADLGSDLVWASVEELVSVADRHDLVCLSP